MATKTVSDSELLDWVQRGFVDVRSKGTEHSNHWLIRYPDVDGWLIELDSNETDSPGDLRTALRAAYLGEGERVVD